MNSQMKKDWIAKNLIIFFAIIITIFLHKILPNHNFYLNNNQYSSVKSYLEISKNAREIGPLISGTEENYEIYSIKHNDPVFPILISALSSLGIQFYTLSEIQLINLILFYFSLLCFSLIFFKKSMWIFGIVQFLIIIYYFQMGLKHTVQFADQHSTVPALTILTFSLVEIFFKNKKKWQYGKLFIFSFLGGVLGMFRNYFTHIFILLIGLISLDILKSKEKNWLRFALALLAILIILNFSNLIQRGFYSYARFKNPDLSFDSDLQPPYSHGIWHNAYIGLGFLKNKWDIQSDDKVGFEHGKHHTPTATYPNPKYYTVMKKLYFKYLTEEPVEYIKNHIKKIFIITTIIVNKNLTLLLIFLLVFYFKLSKCRNQAIKALSMNPAHFIPFFIFFIVPVVTIPWLSYAILTYASLLIIKLIAKNMEIQK